MSTSISFPVIVSSLSTKVDGSIKVSLETQELSPKDSAVLFELRGATAWAIISPSEIKDEDVKLPTEKADPAIGNKTPSQRMRNVLYRLWEQSKDGVDFESFYRIKTSAIIEQLKGKLE